MTVESNYVIAIATLSDWLKRLAPVWEAKPKPIAPCTRDFSRASSELQVIARNCDWFMALFVPVVIGQSDYLVLFFWQSFENRSNLVGKLAANVRIVFQRVLVVHQLQLFRRMVFISQILFSRGCYFPVHVVCVLIGRFYFSFRPLGLVKSCKLVLASMILKQLKR